MLKHFFLFAICILTLNFSATSQDAIGARIKWSESLKTPANTYLSKVIASDASGHYILRRTTGLVGRTNKINIEHYDSNMEFVRGEKIDLRYNKKDRDFEDVIMLDGQLYLLTTFNNDAKKKNYLFTQKISKRLQPAKDIKKIAEIDTRNKAREGSYDFHISRDSSKVLVYNALPLKNRDAEQFALQVFDNTFESLWSKNVTLPYDNDRFAVEEYKVSNTGDVYMMGVIYQDKNRTRRRGKPTYSYTVLAYTKDGDKKREYRISLDDKFITDLTFEIDNDGDLVCSGFYSNKGTYSIKGTYFFKIDTETKEVYDKNLKEFDFDFITEDYNDRKKERLRRAEERESNRAPELFQYDLDKLILRSDGGAILVAEQFFIEQRYNNFNRYGNTTFDIFYYYNDIIVVNIKPNGEIQWASRIPKRQLTSNDQGYFSSYAMAIGKDKLYFVYNDNGRNFDDDPNNRIRSFNGRNSVIALSEVYKDGTVKSYPIASNRDERIITRPKVCKQSGRNEMLIYGELNRKFKLGALTFD